MKKPGMKVGAKKMQRMDVWKMCYLRYLGYSFTKIGKIFCRDHSTVLNHCKIWNVKPGQRGDLPTIDFENDEVIEENRAALEDMYQEKKTTGCVQPRRLTVHKYADKIFAPTTAGKDYDEYLESANLKRVVNTHDHIFSPDKTKRVRCRDGSIITI